MSQQALIDYWSYSSMSSLLSNPLAFKKQYILKQYDNISGPSSVVGSAGHKALEMYYKGLDQAAAIAEGLRYINDQSDMGINYGKTGSRAKIIDTYTKAIHWYFEEMRTPHEILGVEESITIEANSIYGEPLPLPIKVKIDLPTRNKLGEIEIIDHKFVGSYSDGNEDNFRKWLQAMFNYHAAMAKYGEAPKRMIFNECKTSLNSKASAGQPQLQPYTYEFDSTADFATFYKLYNDCTRQISLDGLLFLPNPNDIFDGQNTFEIYRAGIADVERPVSVPHKTEQVAYQDKTYMPSAHNSAGNGHLTPEEKIRAKLVEFGISVEMAETNIGASVTQYTMRPSRGVAMSKLSKLDRDLALALEAKSLRIEAPIRGTDMVGVEVPSAVRKTIKLEESHYQKGTMSIPIGVDVYGKLVRKDLSDMPHALIAGATGAGKSVFLNGTITSLTQQLGPEALKLVLIDPKQVELSQFESLPHLLQPIIHDHIDAGRALDSMVKLMEARYKELKSKHARTIEEYNSQGGAMPKVVVVIDEFADLMMMSSGSKSKDTLKKNAKGLAADLLEYNAGNIEQLMYLTGPDTKDAKAMKKQMLHMITEAATPDVPDAEESIIRIAQKARAVGIHLILATQRPSADVVTGLIKANIPTKICFMTTSRVNSIIVLDQTGAEELTGKGDMLYSDPGSGVQRLQGLYI